MRYTNCLIAFLFFCSISFSQTNQFSLMVKDVNKEKSLLNAVTDRYNKDLSGLSGSNKKYLAEVYKERYEGIKEKFAEDEIVTDQKASAYLEKLTNEILKVNPSLNSDDLRVVFSKAWWPNASNMGDGTILFNIGLFHRLQNESQAAFVLCHELAHYYLNHGNNNILRYVNTVYSDEFQKQLKSIQKSDYQKNKQVEFLAKNLTFKTRRHSREFEQAADSMALEFLKNTNYDVNEALSCLALLDSVDKDKFNCKLQLAQRFDFPSFHFKKNWTQTDALRFTSANEKEKEETDSLKTHPDCKTRIDKLTAATKKYYKPGSKKFIVSESEFLQLINQFDYEIIAYCYENKKVSRALYYSLEMLNFFPDNVYLHTMTGKCLNEIYSRQKAHELSKIANIPGPEFNEEYNQLLHLLQNIRLTEIAALSYYFLNQYQHTDESNKEFSSVFQTSKENFNN